MRGARTLTMITTLCMALTAPAQQWTKQTLKTAWESQWSQVSDIEVTYDWINEGSAEAQARGLMSRLHITFRWDGTRYWWSGVDPDAPGPAGAISFDRALSQQLMLYYADGRPYGQIETRPAGYYVGLLWLERAMRPPAPHAPDLSLTQLLDSDLSTLRPALETVDNRQAAVLDVFGPPESDMAGQIVKSIWLDIERNAVPLKVEMYGPNGAPLLTIWQRGYVQIDGVWLPTRIDSLDGGAHMPGLGTRLIVARDANGTPQIRINSGLTPAQCTVQFPEGTLVTNADTGDEYVAQAVQPTEQIARKLYAAGQQHRQRFARLVPGRSSWLALGLAAVLGVLLGLRLQFGRV